MHFLLETSPGDFVDKLTILEIKSERITDPAKLANVRHELELLRTRWAEAPAETRGVTPLIAELKTINEKLWDVEDRIRQKEAAREFDDEFIALARSVYVTNDARGALKRRVNLALGSLLIEEKSYPDHGATPV